MLGQANTSQKKPKQKNPNKKPTANPEYSPAVVKSLLYSPIDKLLRPWCITDNLPYQIRNVSLGAGFGLLVNSAAAGHRCWAERTVH